MIHSNKPRPIVMHIGNISEYALDYRQLDKLVHELLYCMETIEHKIDEDSQNVEKYFVILRGMISETLVTSSIDKRLILPSYSLNLTGITRQE